MAYHCKIRCRGVLVHNNKLLVVRHKHQDIEADFYALPGGHLEYGENPQECMVREIKEELGISPAIGRLLYIHTLVPHEGAQSIEFFFEVTNGEEFVRHEEREKTHAHEIAEVSWVSPHETFHILPEAFGRAWREGRVFDEGVRFI